MIKPAALLLLLPLLAEARIVAKHGRTATAPASASGGGPMPCSAPVQKARVHFPESIVGRAKGDQGWSGYVNVTEHDHLFYWFFEAQANASTAPLVFWSNGGPGCSAMEGATTEHGPLSLTYIKLSHDLATGQLSDNPWAWSKNANIVYVDQPRYVGYSYGAGPKVTSSVDAGLDMVTFITGFLERFPELKGRPVYLAAESYGGHYVPAWAGAVMDHNEKAAAAAAQPGLEVIPLAGAIIGNGCVNFTEQNTRTYEAFLKSADLIPASASPADEDAANALMAAHIGYSPNYYDWRIRDIACEACYSYNYTKWSLFFTQQEVIEALNVCGDAGTAAPGNAFAGAAGGCIDLPSFDEGDTFDYSGAMARMLEKDLTVTFFYGMNDRACDYVGGYNMAKTIEWSGREAFGAAAQQPLELGGTSGGMLQQYKGLSFLQIAAAGHMVPQDQPAAAAFALTTAINNKQSQSYA
jgi:carboxypeptidase C (cathepsin A)